MTTCLDHEIWICTALDGVVMLGGGGGSSAPQTTTTTSSPWASQQPYLIEGFQGAQNLYGGSGPQYYPDSTYSGYTPNQFSALGQVPGVAASNMGGIDTSAGGFENFLLGGNYLADNPAMSGFRNFSSSWPASALSYFANNNAGYNAPGSNTLTNIAGTNYGTAGNNLGSSMLAGLGGTNMGLSNPGTPELGSLAGTNLGIDNLGTPTLAGLSNTNLGFANPGTPTLGAYASGAYGSNPATNALSQNVLSQVVPSVESQFVNGGALSSPQAAYSTASGATTALAPSLFQNYQTQEQLQQNAAQNLAGNYLQGGALQNAAAQNLAQNTLAGGQLQGNAAQNLAGNYLQGGALQSAIGNELAQNQLSGAGLQSNAASTLGNQFLTGTGLSENAASTLGSENLQALSGLSGAYGQGVQQMLTGSAFAPSVQNMPYTDLSNLFGAGSAEQTNAQNALNANIAQWNYYQTLPYQMLNQYEGQVTGNYGGTVTEPYFSNSSGSNALGGALSGASAGAGIGSALFGAGTGGAAGGAGLGALAGLLLL